MSYERFDTDGRPAQKEDCWAQCLGSYDPREDPMEFLSLISLTSLVIGIFLVMAGYLIPRDYTFDPTMDAIKMEQIEMYYDKLAYQLDVLVLVGMSFVVLGGLILAGIICYLHVTADFWAQVCGDEMEEERQRERWRDGGRQNHYQGQDTSTTQERVTKRPPPHHQGYGSNDRPNVPSASSPASSVPTPLPVGSGSGNGGLSLSQPSPSTPSALPPDLTDVPAMNEHSPLKPRSDVHAFAPSQEMLETSQ